MLSFPPHKVRGHASKVGFRYTDRIPKIGLVCAKQGDGITAALDLFNLVQAEPIAAVLTDENRTFLYIVSTTGRIADLAGIERGSDRPIPRFYSKDFHRLTI